MERAGAARPITVAYIGGGSRGWAWGFMADLALSAELTGVVRLYDIDRPAAEANAVIGARIAAHPRARSRWRYEVSDSLAEALSGADFAVISILPGTFREMRVDVHAPEALGIWQSVGDTVGPGGFVRALRAVPMLFEIGRAIRAHAPEAWVINYTNPMSLCVAALYEAFPGIRALGCCHEVFGAQKLLSAMLAEMEGIRAVPRDQIRVDVTGINHFTWLTGASYDGLDLFPLFRRFADAHCDAGFTADRDAGAPGDVFACTHRVKFDLFRRTGLIAAAGDRHLAEFMPEYLRDPETAHAWGFCLTGVDFREADLQRRLRRSAALVSGAEAVDLKPSGEEGHLLIQALAGLGDRISNVNLPNRGQAEGLPSGAVVETNALIRCGDIRPVPAGALPDDVQALVARHALNQQHTLRAALTCDYPLALRTFLRDPMLMRTAPADGDALLRSMMKRTAAYLPAAWGIEKW